MEARDVRPGHPGPKERTRTIALRDTSYVAVVGQVGFGRRTALVGVAGLPDDPERTTGRVCRYCGYPEGKGHVNSCDYFYTLPDGAREAAVDANLALTLASGTFGLRPAPCDYHSAGDVRDETFFTQAPDGTAGESFTTFWRRLYERLFGK